MSRRGSVDAAPLAASRTYGGDVQNQNQSVVLNTADAVVPDYYLRATLVRLVSTLEERFREADAKLSRARNLAVGGSLGRGMIENKRSIDFGSLPSPPLFCLGNATQSQS